MLKVGISFATILALFVSLPAIGLCAGPFLNPLAIGLPVRLIPEDEINRPDRTPFVLGGRSDYQGVSWITSVGSGDRIGIAPWNAVNKRWNLISLHDKYSGFVQATLGERAPHEHYRQYLQYDRDGKYQVVHIATLGGRPKTPDLPQGELGGQLISYQIGNIPLVPMGRTVIINYAKIPGINIAIVPRLR